MNTTQIPDLEAFLFAYDKHPQDDPWMTVNEFYEMSLEIADGEPSFYAVDIEDAAQAFVRELLKQDAIAEAMKENPGKHLGDLVLRMGTLHDAFKAASSLQAA